MSLKIIDMTGKRYASIVALRITSKSASGDLKWLFICDCGTEFEANGYYARCGKIISCPKCSAERTRLASVKHGLSETVEFYTWTDIQTRCYNKNIKAFKNYGGRGIKVCDRWLKSFLNFLSDMGTRPSSEHSIERNDVDGDYEPNNCRWATDIEQANNRRSNIKISINGEVKTLAQLAKDSGLKYHTVWARNKSKKSKLISPVVRGSIVFNGIRDTYDGWSKRTGLKISTIYMRIKSYGWSIEKALTKGAKQC